MAAVFIIYSAANTNRFIVPQFIYFLFLNFSFGEFPRRHGVPNINRFAFGIDVVVYTTLAYRSQKSNYAWLISTTFATTRSEETESENLGTATNRKKIKEKKEATENNRQVENIPGHITYLQSITSISQERNIRFRSAIAFQLKKNVLPDERRSARPVEKA